MAVKVMYARALQPQGAGVGGVASNDAPSGAVAKKAEAEKPRRRKTSVYDAEGNEVFITLMCLKCHKMRPLAQFGLRRMADGAIRNQPWCRPCRSDASPKKRKETSPSEDPSVSVAPSETQAPSEAAPRDAGILAAQVAAALHAGRR